MPSSKPLLRALTVALVLCAPCAARADDPPDPSVDASEAVAPRLRPESVPVLAPLPPGAEPVSVTVELTVDADGVPRDPVVLVSGGLEVDREALTAALALRFEPARYRGESVAARIPFRFDFAPPVMAAAAPPSAPPQPPPPPVPPPIELTFDVQGARPPRETTVYTLSVEQLRTLPGTGGDPLRAVESLPGVARPPSFAPTLIVRGSGPYDSGVFVDGIQIPLSYHFGGFSSVVPGEALERFELRPGNFGAEYSRFMGGVLELGLRAPRRDRFGGVAQVDAIDGRVMVEGPLGARTRFLIGARRSWVDAWLGAVDASIQQAPVYYDGQAVLEHTLSARTTLRLFFVGSDDRLRLLIDAPSAQDPALAGKLAVGTRFTRLALRADTRFSDSTSGRFTFSWGTDHVRSDIGTESTRIDANTLDARAELRTRNAAWLSHVIGLDTQLWSYGVDLRFRPYPPDMGGVTAPFFALPVRTLGADVWLVRPALYAMAEITPLPGLRLVPGVRADYARDSDRITVDPRLSARYAHSGTTFKGGLGLYSQPPRGVESVRPFGSPGVRASRALHAGLGLEQELWTHLRVSLEGFYKRLDRLVVAEADASADNVGARFSNAGSGRVVGGEAWVRYEHGRLTGSLAYTLMRSERREAPRAPLHLADYDQTHVLTAITQLRFRRNVTLGARFRYVTGMPVTPVEGGVVDLDAGAYTPVPGAYFSARVPAFHQLDLRVDKAWRLGALTLTAYLELRNAYNRKNADSLGYQFDYTRAKPQATLPILPVIGLRGEL